MQLTILGAGAVRPNAGGACSGYLLETSAAVVLVECGSGVLSRLLLHRKPVELDAVIISHDHPDHWLDLIALQMTLAHAPGPQRSVPLPVFAGPGVTDTIRDAGAVVDDTFWRDITFHTVDPACPLQVGDVSVTFAPSSHSRPSWAMRFAGDGRGLVYTADTADCQQVQDLAIGADLLLAEATLGARGTSDPESGHMTASDAARLAERAGVGHVVLTHYFAERGVDEMVTVAAKHCSMPVHVAKEGEVHVV